MTSIISQLGLITGVIIVYFVYPVTYVRLIAEDNWGQYATFVALLIASGLFTKSFISSQTKKRDLWYALFATGTFFVAMEEISWGQRILGVGTPHFFRTINYQSEIGFHNIWDELPGDNAYLVVSIGFIIYGFILPMLITVSSRFCKIVRSMNFPVPPLHLSPLFIATSYFLGFSSLVKSDEIGELFMGISLGYLALYFTLYDLQSLKRYNKAEWLKALAFPAFIALTLVIGALFAHLWELPGSFKSRVNSTGTRLTRAGHIKQAEVIFSYLEKHPELKKNDMLINKGRLLRKINRMEQANVVFKEALDLEFRRIARSPNNPEIMLRIAKIYSETGNVALENKYLKAALDIFEERLMTTDSPRKLAKWHLARAEIYEVIGDYNQSIEEYIKASEFASNASMRNEIEWGVGHVLYVCRSMNKWRRVPWKEIQLMPRKFNRSETDWCRQEN